MSEKETFNYVAAWHDYDQDKIVVVERDDEGNRRTQYYNPPYYFFVPEDDGERETLFGDKVTRIEVSTKGEYDHVKNHFPKRFESDFTPVKRVLMDNYYGRPSPKVHYAIIDIEADYTKSIGFPSPNKDSGAGPYAPVNAVTIYQSWTGKCLTYAVPPPEWKGTMTNILFELERLKEQKHLRDETPEIEICKDERELLTKYLAAIEDSDVVSGWNIEFFDVPYLCERVKHVFGEAFLVKLDMKGCRTPRQKMVEHYGTMEPVWEFTGRSYVDYMALFKKFSFGGRPSYSLGNILEEEVSVGKLHYEGTLEELYHNDFPKFVAYNFRDVDGVVQLNEKHKFLELMNMMVHENTVMFSAALGTVALIETGVANYAHNVLDRIVNDKIMADQEKVEGAIVLSPRIGLHKYIGSIDLKSLYPSTIRSLNISPEMVVGQFAAKEDAWMQIRLDNDDANESEEFTFILEDGTSITKTVEEWRDILIEKMWALSAYGTVFDQSRGPGILNRVLTDWYADRKKLQAEKRRWENIYDAATTEAEKTAAEQQIEYYEMRQMVRKLLLNSLYGALLNKAFRFGDIRLGASTTGSGRGITTHMIETVSKFLDESPEKLYRVSKIDESEDYEEEDGDDDIVLNNVYASAEAKIDFIRVSENQKAARVRSTETIYAILGDPHRFDGSVIYSDTDSCYFKTNAQNKEDAIAVADATSEFVNSTFKDFTKKAYFCNDGFDDLIACNREIVGLRGLWQAKKKYLVKVIDQEGRAVDKLKSQGSEIKKSDTPKRIQNFLKETTTKILDGESYDEVTKFVNEQRKVIIKDKKNFFSLGVNCQINNLNVFMAEYNAPGTVLNAKGKKLTIPWHVRAALNYNKLIDSLDPGSKPIQGGDKVAVFSVKKNAYNMSRIAFPSELSDFPKWFKENFEVDTKETEKKMFDKKLLGVFRAWGHDVPSPQSVLTNRILEF